MKVISFINNNPYELVANGYILFDEKNNCVVIDPGKADNQMVDFIKKNNLTLQAILLTHGHFDHIGGVSHILKTFDVPVYIHKNDQDYLFDTHLNCSDRFSRKDIVFNSKINVKYIENECELHILEKTIKVIETPFHTMGSICYLIPDENILFSGDTLFCESIGRTDLERSNPSLIDGSLAKLMLLNEDTKVYPGHGPETTINHEKKQNSFVKK